MRYLYLFLGISLLVIVAAVRLEQSLPYAANPQFDVAFAPGQARYLGLDPAETYRAILTDLKPAHVRLQANWSDIEPEPGQFSFTELDRLVSEAASAGTAVTLAVGRKLPHWPECQDPVWLKDLKPWELDERLSQMLTAVVMHYRSHPSIVRWQLENEPMFGYGDCPPPNWHRLRAERDLLRSLDHTRPILLTDSGELSSWWETAGLADEQGTTLYRVTWNSFLGYFNSPWPPFYYRLKAALVSPFVKRTVVSELQLEPWAPAGLVRLSLAEAKKSFDLNRFAENVQFFRRTGLSEAVVWGAEWWYAALKHGDAAYWQAGQQLFHQPVLTH